MPLIRYEVKVDETLDFDAFAALLREDDDIDPDVEEAKSVAERKMPWSKVERSVVKDNDYCKLCAINNDPANVPVHPHCQCQVRTDGIESGMSDDLIPDLVKRFTTDPVDIITLDGDTTEYDFLIPNASTVSVIEFKNFRFGDLAKWAEEHEELVSQAAQAITIMSDNESLIEGTEQAESGFSIFLTVHELVGKGQFTLQDEIRVWRGPQPGVAVAAGTTAVGFEAEPVHIEAAHEEQEAEPVEHEEPEPHPRVVLLPPQSGPEQLAQGYRKIMEG